MTNASSRKAIQYDTGINTESALAFAAIGIFWIATLLRSSQKKTNVYYSYLQPDK